MTDAQAAVFDHHHAARFEGVRSLRETDRKALLNPRRARALQAEQHDAGDRLGAEGEDLAEVEIEGEQNALLLDGQREDKARSA